MKIPPALAVLLLPLLGATVLPAQEAEKAEEAKEEKSEKKEETGPLNSGTLSGLKLRPIGPALASGRISDFAVDPENPARYFVATASGGVWKTDNAGTTWSPLFDGQGSYSIGVVTLDPDNSNVVWVGTGENNSQRSVSFGDGVYKSVDGGRSWKNVGLKDSEHIGSIVVDPRDSDTVFVAAQGPLWREGGDRGLYKTTDGGQTWAKVLEIDEHTGVNEMVMDPRDPDVLYASSYQRRRHVWTLINGGPGSGIHKSTDGGATWRKIRSGLPGADLGRIGLAISPVDPDILYAIAEAAEGQGGFFRSTNRGETWRKMSSTMTSSPQYYNEIYCDPVDADRVYLLDTRMQVTDDGGATFSNVPGRNKHVDDHALWIDPEHTDHLLVGCDGGIYETFDRGANWAYKPNLPLSQFYRVSVDESQPFYYVYGGTQDNNSMGGPSRTLSRAGIANEDWFVTVGGDGYETVVDPTDPNILYSLWQYGGLVRHDRRSGEVVDIKPRELPGEEAYRWNWDSPLMLSPHSHTRLYFAANRLFRSDDRGNSWRAVSADLSKQLDRNKLEVMGRVWGVDAVSKNRSTSFYGNIVALDESPLVEGLIYVGTDDGLIQVTEDGGENWTKFAAFPDIPELAYVSYLVASRHDADTVYAAFHNHKMGDFKPYLLKSADRGRTWTSIAGDLPERNFVWCLAEDHEKADLLFVGTEFGLFCTLQGGDKWLKLRGGLPTIAVRDLAIQRRENDLVLATFGRSFYVLDDYTPLRRMSEELLERDAVIFPVKDPLLYIPNSRLGGGGSGSQGAAFFTAPNPPFGAVITYYVKESYQTRQQKRRSEEKKEWKEGGNLSYPSWEELRAEDQEVAPMAFLTVRDEDGEVVQKITASTSKGVHRVAWNLRYPSSNPIRGGGGSGRFGGRGGGSGPLALPGTYTVTLSQKVDGALSTLAGPVAFEVVPLGLATLEAEDKAEALAFHKKVARLQRALGGAQQVASDAQSRLQLARQAVLAAPAADVGLLTEIDALERRLSRMLTQMNGDSTKSRRQEPTPPSIRARVQHAASNLTRTTNAPTQTERDAYRFAGEAFGPVLEELRKFVDTDLPALEKQLEAAGAPWTPGRPLPDWRIE